MYTSSERPPNLDMAVICMKWQFLKCLPILEKATKVILTEVAHSMAYLIPLGQLAKMGHFLESLAVPMESRKDSILSVHFETSA